MARMTYVEAAVEVLRNAGRGRRMHHRDIYETVVTKGLWVSRARRRHVGNSTYGTLIKAVRGGDPRLDRDQDHLALFFAI